MTAGEAISLELDDIQSGALHERPSPYIGSYLLLRIDDRAAGRELVRRLHRVVDSGRPSSDPAHDAWITVANRYEFFDDQAEPVAMSEADLGAAGPPSRPFLPLGPRGR